MYLADVGDGTLTLHSTIRGDVTHNRLKEFEVIFMHLIAGLSERGMRSLDTWIDFGVKEQHDFAAFFGFETTGFLKTLTYEDGTVRLMEEMTYVFPIDDED